jgi:hypothetical protein
MLKLIERRGEVMITVIKNATFQYFGELHCFQLRTTLNGKDFKFFSHGLCTEKQNILLQHMREKMFWFWSINMEISINTKTRLQVMTWSLVFVLIKIKNYFSCMCWRRMFYFSVHSPWEKNLKSFPFKVVLSWKQCSCDVIIERVYYNIVNNLIYTHLFLGK